MGNDGERKLFGPGIASSYEYNDRNTTDFLFTMERPALLFCGFPCHLMDFYDIDMDHMPSNVDNMVAIQFSHAIDWNVHVRLFEHSAVLNNMVYVSR